MTEIGISQRRGIIQLGVSVDAPGAYPSDASIASVRNFSKNITTPDFTPYNKQSYSPANNPVPTPSTVVYYKMRARDPDCGSITYRSWVVTGSPDYTAASYSGTRCGGTALTDITVAFKWST